MILVKVYHIGSAFVNVSKTKRIIDIMPAVSHIGAYADGKVERQ
ncbi:hypothetical protein JNUCC74_04135 [Cerasibacillus sp. JNUCC 74]